MARFADIDKLLEKQFFSLDDDGFGMMVVSVTDIISAPTVEAVELQKGKPGDYLEWDNGTGFRQIYHIHAVMICEDCIRYDLEKFAPVVDHKNIVRIMSREEAEKEWHERCATERAKEEPNLAACRSDMRGDGDGK